MRLSIGLILIIGSFAWLHAGTVHPSAEPERLNATIGQMIMLEFKIDAPQYLESGAGAPAMPDREQEGDIHRRVAPDWRRRLSCGRGEHPQVWWI